MAQAYANVLGRGLVQAQSAGLEAGKLNHRVVAVMAEDGVDIREAVPRKIDVVLESGAEFDVLVTVCDEASAERCPYVPGRGERLHWSFADPSAFTGTELEIMEFTRKVRDQIKQHISEWLAERVSS
jgi:arsenate reductase